MNAMTLPGFGDVATWGPVTSSRDPRTDEPSVLPFSDTHIDWFIQEFAQSTGSASAWLISVGCDPLGDANGDGTVNELIRALCFDSIAGKPFSGSESHYQIIKKLALQAYNSGEWK